MNSGKNPSEPNAAALKNSAEKQKGVVSSLILDKHRKKKTADEVSEQEIFSHCVLPEGFFDYAIAQSKSGKTSLLTIESWDGRSVMSVKRHA